MVSFRFLLSGIFVFLSQGIVYTEGYFISQSDPMVQKIAQQASLTIPGAIVDNIKSVSREEVPAGWKYYIVMDIVRYNYITGLKMISECEVVAVYLAYEDRSYLPQPVVCT